MRHQTRIILVSHDLYYVTIFYTVYASYFRLVSTISSTAMINCSSIPGFSSTFRAQSWHSNADHKNRAYHVIKFIFLSLFELSHESYP